MSARGFSLIEAMIVSAVVVMLSLFQAEMVANLARTNHAQATLFDYLQFIQSVNYQITTPQTCALALLGEPYQPVLGAKTIVTFHDPSGPITMGSAMGSFKISQMELNHVTGTAQPFTYGATLNVSGEKLGDITGPRGMHKALKLTVVAPAGVVTECYSASELTLSKVCASMLGTFDPVSQICGAIP